MHEIMVSSNHIVSIEVVTHFGNKKQIRIDLIGNRYMTKALDADSNEFLDLYSNLALLKTPNRFVTLPAAYDNAELYTDRRIAIRNLAKELEGA